MSLLTLNSIPFTPIKSIVVVEFDGDEDDNHVLPQRHIPARFITLIPQEFPAAKVKKKVTSKKAGSGRASPTSKKRSGTHATKISDSSKAMPPAAASGAASVASASSGIDESLIAALAKGTGFGDLDLGSFSFDDLLSGSSTPKKHVTVATSYADIVAQKRSQEDAKSSGSKSSKKKAAGGGGATTAKSKKTSAKKRGASKGGADKNSKKKKKTKAKT